MKKIFLSTVIFFLFSAGMNVIAQTTGKQETEKWFAEQEWLGGLQLQPHTSVNKKEFARQYRINKTYWDKAFLFLKEHDLQTIPLGKILIDSNNVYAMVTENPTKDYDSTRWESHKNYIDLHYVIKGKEKIAVSDIKNLTITNPYDSSKDVVNYSGSESVYSATPGTFFIFFPTDAHRPGIAADNKDADKKIVIKIRYAE